MRPCRGEPRCEDPPHGPAGQAAAVPWECASGTQRKVSGGGAVAGARRLPPSRRGGPGPHGCPALASAPPCARAGGGSGRGREGTGSLRQPRGPQPLPCLSPSLGPRPGHPAAPRRSSPPARGTAGAGAAGRVAREVM